MSSIVSKIELIGSYGLTSEYEYKETSCGLRYLQLPQMDRFDLDLLDGFSERNFDQHRLRIIEDYKNRNKIVNTIKWMKNHREQTDGVQFICGTAWLQRASSLLFKSGNVSPGREWIAIKINGLITIWGMDGSFKLDDRRIEDRYAGFKFEAKFTEKINWRDKSSQYYCVMRATIDDNKLIYSFQPDCIEHIKDDNVVIEDFVELKTVRVHRFKEYYRVRNFQMWWSKLSITGVKKLVVGIKDDNHRCIGIERFNADQLVSDQDKQSTYSLWNKLLNGLRGIVIEEGIVYKFDFDANGNITSTTDHNVTADQELKELLQSW